MYEILPHRADMTIQARGKTREEALRCLLQGMFTAAEPRFEGGEDARRPFDVHSDDAQSLAIDFLNAVLAESDIHHEAYGDVKFTKLSDAEATGILIGRKVRGFETQVKAATHHDLHVSREPDGDWTMRVTFDV